jgi:glutathione peroxidase
MATGIVKWYNDAKGFGFINDHVNNDLVLIQRENIANDTKVVFEFETVEYETTDGPNGPIALNIKTTRKQDMNFYDHEFTTLTGEKVHLSKYVGKVILVVNSASMCGYTGQYRGLEWLYNNFKDHGFVVLAFPSDNFGQQEYSNNEEIKNFCEREYNTTFPIFERTDVVGDNANSFYKMLKGITGEEPAWNFHKYLINKQGTEVVSLNQEVRPPSEIMCHEVKRMLEIE